MPKLPPSTFLENCTERLAQFDELPNSALLNTRELCFLSGRSPSSILRDVKGNRLATPIKIGPNSVRWRVSDVRRYLEGGE